MYCLWGVCVYESEIQSVFETWIVLVKFSYSITVYTISHQATRNISLTKILMLIYINIYIFTVPSWENERKQQKIWKYMNKKTKTKVLCKRNRFINFQFDQCIKKLCDFCFTNNWYMCTNEWWKLQNSCRRKNNKVPQITSGSVFVEHWIHIYRLQISKTMIMSSYGCECESKPNVRV